MLSCCLLLSRFWVCAISKLIAYEKNEYVVPNLTLSSPETFCPGWVLNSDRHSVSVSTLGRVTQWDSKSILDLKVPCSIITDTQDHDLGSNLVTKLPVSFGSKHMMPGD